MKHLLIAQNRLTRPTHSSRTSLVCGCRAVLEPGA